MYALTPTTFDGTSINDASYVSKFLRAQHPLTLVSREPVEVEAAGDYAHPTSPRSQPESRIIPLSVQILATTQAAMTAFKKLFNPYKGDVILKATDDDAVTWRLTCRIIDYSLNPRSADLFTVRLYAAKPVWESDSSHADAETVSATPSTWNLNPTPVGTVHAYPSIEIKPTAAKAHTADYLYRWQVVIANRSELELVDSRGLGYPIDVANNALDTATEIAASRMQADGDDLRVLVDGEEVERWLDDINDATTKVWCNIAFKPMRHVTLDAAWASGADPAVGAWFTVNNPEGTLGWDDAGFMVIGTECVQYDDRTSTQFKIKARGARNTTAAAHAADADAYWVEHEIILLTDYTAAADPPVDADRKPVIDLTNSTNEVHKYPGPIIEPGTLRTGQLLRRYKEVNALSGVISMLDDDSDLRFRDTAPSADAPRFNQVELYVPCGVKAAASAIVHDVTVEDLLGLNVYGVDLEGYVALLERYHSQNDGAAKALQPAAILSRLVYRADTTIITGGFTDDVSDTIITTTPAYQQFTLDAISDIYAVLLRLKESGTPNGDVEVWLCSDDGDTPSARISPILTITGAGVGASYADFVKRWNEAGGREYLSLDAGSYWIAARRTDSTGGGDNIVAWSFSTTQTYPKGGFGASGAGPQGPNSPGTLADDATVGSQAWTNPANAGASDDAHATCGPFSSTFSHYLKATNFSFTIPAAATIKGIEVEAEKKATGSVDDYSVRLVKAGAITGEDKPALWPIQWPAADAYTTYGSPSDLWGETWTPTDINNVGFGAVISANVRNGTGYIDHIRITVYYEIAAGTPEQTAHFAVIGAPGATPQSEAPSGSAHKVVLDDIAPTFDNTTPRTPLIVVNAKETIYWVKGTLKNDDSGQEIAISIPLALNDYLTIDCATHAVTRSDTGESVPGLITPSDLEEWMRVSPTEESLRWTETGVGTIVVTPTWRDQFA